MKLTLALYSSLLISAFAIDPHVEAVIRTVEGAKGKVEKTEDGQSLKSVDLAVPNTGPHDKRESDPYDAAFFEHLGHGAASWLQSLGFRHPKYPADKLGLPIAAFLFIGYMVPPTAVLLGGIR